MSFEYLVGVVGTGGSHPVVAIPGLRRKEGGRISPVETSSIICHGPMIVTELCRLFQRTIHISSGEYHLVFIRECVPPQGTLVYLNRAWQRVEDGDRKTEIAAIQPSRLSKSRLTIRMDPGWIPLRALARPYFLVRRQGTKQY